MNRPLFRAVMAGLVLLAASPVSAGELEERVREGVRLFKEGDYAAARGEFESARVDAPERPEFPFNIALTY